MFPTTRLVPLIAVSVLAGLAPPQILAQPVNKLIVEIKTADVRFAGTDDPIHLIFGGQDFKLDNPSKDDFERNNRDTFELSPVGMDFALIRAIGTIAIVKTGDSFFGGGWKVEGITIWADSNTTPPLYQNPSIQKWLDGGDLEWHTTLGEPGWTVPEPPPFPPCVSGDIDLGTVTDSDCDGIPDGSDTSFTPGQDQDGDGLPDLYETLTGLNPTDPDSDADGWWDGRNRRSILILVKVDCRDEEEDVGSDEIFITSEDVRFPVATTLNAYWAMDDNSVVFPGAIVDSRVAAGANAASPPLSYKTRIRLRESDFEFFESPTDDTYTVRELTWGENQTIELVHETGDAHYMLTFQSRTLPFNDPSPLGDNDTDSDGLRDNLEFLISTQNSTVQPSVIPGYDGLTDPTHRDLFLEIDTVNTARLSYDAKQAVASQLYAHAIHPRIDDGHLGGGQNIITALGQPAGPMQGPTAITMDDLENTLRPANFADVRRKHFRYGLYVEVTAGEGRNGVARGKNLIVAIETMLGDFSAIVLMHELGHTLGLCHPGGDGKPPEVSATCPTPTNWPHIGCRHYCGVGDDAVTAMGADIGLDSILIGAGAGALIGGLAGFAIGGPLGAVLGALIGGFLGSLLGLSNADAYLRVVDFHTNEWNALRFW